MFLQLKLEYKMLSYVKSTSITSQSKNISNDKMNNNISSVEANDPFKCVAILMDDYFD